MSQGRFHHSEAIPSSWYQRTVMLMRILMWMVGIVFGYPMGSQLARPEGTGGMASLLWYDRVGYHLNLKIVPQ